jgi:hypothetical protein
MTRGKSWLARDNGPLSSELRGCSAAVAENTELPPYCRDVTDTAPRSLRASMEEMSKPQVQRMALYWSAKFSTTLGEYDDTDG